MVLVPWVFFIVVLFVVRFQVMPPQYLEHSDESSSGGVPLTPVSHGLGFSTNSTFKGESSY